MHAVVAVVDNDLRRAGSRRVPLRGALGIGLAEVLREHARLTFGLHAPDAVAVGVHVQ